MAIERLLGLKDLATNLVGQTIEKVKGGAEVGLHMAQTIINERKSAKKKRSGHAASQAPARPHPTPADFAAAAEAGVCPFTGQRADGTIPGAAETAPVADAPKAPEAKAPVAAEAKAPASAPAKAAEKPAAKPAEKVAEKAEAAPAPVAKPAAAKAKPAAKPATPLKASKKPTVTPAPAAKLGSELDNLEAMSRKELYDLATELDVKGRKDKKKEELIVLIRAVTNG